MKNKVYIAGLPRGGTTLISLLIGSHPEVMCMGETIYLARLNPKDRKCSCGKIGCEECTKIYNQVNKLKNAHMLYEAYGALDAIREPEKICGPDTIHSIVPQKAKGLKKLITQGVEGINDISNVFKRTYNSNIFVDSSKEIRFAKLLINDPSWLVVLITRDLRGVANSTVKAGIRKNVPRNIKEKFKTWNDFANNGKYLLSKNVIHVKYEDLCINPLYIINEIGKELGLVYKQEMFTENKAHHLLVSNRMANDFTGKISMDNDWETNLEDNEIYLIQNSVKNYFKYFNYSLKK